MNKKRTSQHLLLLLTDIAAIYISIILAFYTRPLFESYMAIIPLGHGLTMYIYKWWIVLIVVLSIAYYGGFGFTITVWDELLVLLKSLFVSFLITWVVLSLQKETESVSRIIITLSFVYMLFIVSILRLLFKFLIYKVLDMRSDAFLLVLSVERESGLMELLNSEWYSGYKIKDIIQKDSIKNEMDTCFVSMSSANEKVIKSIKPCCKNLILVSEISGLSFMSTEIKTLLSKNIAFITTNNGLLSPWNMVFKRAFEVIFSLLAIILLFPIFLLILIIIKIDSKGPAFFLHKRCGKNLVEFDMIKFRTMHINSEGMLHEHIAENSEACIDLKEKNKVIDDPRVTRPGKILRKTSLDELPQLFNVLKGEMSIVGPRPDSREAIGNFLNEYQEIYAKVRPGITGLWQVSGRSNIKYEERVRLDYLYVLNWSMWLDFIIALKTFYAVLSGKGAY
jgi:undecaprenyl-phosphate galactose phosphotransferase